MTVFKLLLKIVVAPVIVLLTLFVWTCVALVYVSGLVLGLASMVIALLGVAVLVTYSPQNGLILLLIAFLISPYGLPKLAFWMLGKVQGLKYTNTFPICRTIEYRQIELHPFWDDRAYALASARFDP